MLLNWMFLSDKSIYKLKVHYFIPIEPFPAYRVTVLPVGYRQRSARRLWKRDSRCQVG